MSEHCFKITLDDHELRKLNKADYKGVMRWLRICRREIEKALDWDDIRQKILYKTLYG